MLVFQNVPEKAVIRISAKEMTAQNAQLLCETFNFHAAMCTMQPNSRQLQAITKDVLAFPHNTVIDYNSADSKIERRFKHEVIEEVINRLLAILTQILALRNDEDKLKQLYINAEMTRLQAYSEAMLKFPPKNAAS